MGALLQKEQQGGFDMSENIKEFNTIDRALGEQYLKSREEILSIKRDILVGVYDFADEIIRNADLNPSLFKPTSNFLNTCQTGLDRLVEGIFMGIDMGEDNTVCLFSFIYRIREVSYTVYVSPILTGGDLRFNAFIVKKTGEGRYIYNFKIKEWIIQDFINSPIPEHLVKTDTDRRVAEIVSRGSEFMKPEEYTEEEFEEIFKRNQEIVSLGIELGDNVEMAMDNKDSTLIRLYPVANKIFKCVSFCYDSKYRKYVAENVLLKSRNDVDDRYFAGNIKVVFDSKKEVKEYITWLTDSIKQYYNFNDTRENSIIVISNRLFLMSVNGKFFVFTNDTRVSGILVSDYGDYLMDEEKRIWENTANFV